MASSRRLLLLAGGIISLGFLAIPAQAQEVKKVLKMQRVIDAQQQQLEDQQNQLHAQRQLLEKLQEQMQSLVKDADRTWDDADTTWGTAIAKNSPAQPPEAPSKPLPEIGGALSQDFKHEHVDPTGANVTQGTAKLKLKVPGTNTEIGIHGFTEFQIIRETHNQDNCEFDTSLIPVDGSPPLTKFCVNPSRLAVSSQTRTPVGRLNTMISMDFNGKLDSPDPRLRVAYGEWINDELDFALLGGQTFGTMLDLKSVPETLDFAGPTGYFARRQPLARFTKLFGRTVTAEVALETPENVAYIDADPLTRWPDFVVAGTWLADREYLSHLRLAGLARDLRAESATGSTVSAFGWAIAGSGKLKLPFLGARDNFKFGVQYGKGYGAQIKSGPADAAFNASNNSFATIPVFSTYGGLQHWWSDSFRSNLVYGYVAANNSGFVDGDELKNTAYAAADLVWQPHEMVNLGFEYLWGNRENEDGAAGTSNRFLLSSRFDF
jgi:hypothetical protein